LADLAKLVSENLDVRVAPIEYQVHDAEGTIKIGDILSAEMAPYRSGDGKPTKLVDIKTCLHPDLPDQATHDVVRQAHRPVSSGNKIEGQAMLSLRCL
jgi:hypothetical protein